MEKKQKLYSVTVVDNDNRWFQFEDLSAEYSNFKDAVNYAKNLRLFVGDSAKYVEVVRFDAEKVVVAYRRIVDC